jgi:NTP pyrophosphatase (non-canonical NTP hydrolase)
VENQAVNLDEIQAAQFEWSARNFGQQPPHRPMLGIIEELCELEEAQLEMSEIAEAELAKEVLDAVGDIAIYMLDYCGKRGWRMQELWDSRACPEWLKDFTVGNDADGFPYFAPFIRRLAHSQLKGEQNIRGGTGKHDGILKATLSSVLWLLDSIATAELHRDFLDILAEVWSKVSKRDWVNNPNTAHEVSEVPS